MLRARLIYLLSGSDSIPCQTGGISIKEWDILYHLCNYPIHKYELCVHRNTPLLFLVTLLLPVMSTPALIWMYRYQLGVL